MVWLENRKPRLLDNFGLIVRIVILNELREWFDLPPQLRVDIWTDDVCIIRLEDKSLMPYIFAGFNFYLQKYFWGVRFEYSMIASRSSREMRSFNSAVRTDSHPYLLPWLWMEGAWSLKSWQAGNKLSFTLLPSFTCRLL